MESIWGSIAILSIVICSVCGFCWCECFTEVCECNEGHITAETEVDNPVMNL